MNDDFEKLLANQELRPMPPDWRAQILRDARMAAPDAETPAAPWWRALLWPSPAAWAGVGCAWVLVAGMTIASRPAADEATAKQTGNSSVDIAKVLAEQKQLVQELFQIDRPPASLPPRGGPPGAFNPPPETRKYETA